jgi:hypothetical protein
MQEELKQDLELKSLDNYYGSEHYYNVLGFNVTDGINYIMQNGYSWFVTDSLAVVMSESKVLKYLIDENFLTIKLLLKDNKKAVMIITDGNDNILYTQKYEYTDAKRELTLYFIDNVLLLNSEY